MTTQLAYSAAVLASAMDAWFPYAGVLTSDAKHYDEHGTGQEALVVVEPGRRVEERPGGNLP